MCGFFHSIYKIFSAYHVPCMILKTGDIMMGGGGSTPVSTLMEIMGKTDINMIILVNLIVASKKVCSCPNSWNL